MTPNPEDRIQRRALGAAVTRSADFTAVNGDTQVFHSDRPTSGGQAEPELEHRGSSGSLQPQPPSVGSPAPSVSPRLKTLSSRTLAVTRAGVVSASQLPDEHGAGLYDRGGQLWRAGTAVSVGGNTIQPQTEEDMDRSPLLNATRSRHRLLASSGGGAASAAAGAAVAGLSSRILAVQRPGSAPGTAPEGVSPPAALNSPLVGTGVATTAAVGFGAGCAAAAAAAASTASSEMASPSTSASVDPWAAIRAHCMAMYGNSLGSSDDEEDGGGASDSDLVRQPGMVMLMRHPSLVRRSLSRSFGGGAAHSPTGPKAGASAAGAMPSTAAGNQSAASADAGAAAGEVDPTPAPVLIHVRPARRRSMSGTGAGGWDSGGDGVADDTATVASAATAPTHSATEGGATPAVHPGARRVTGTGGGGAVSPPPPPPPPSLLPMTRSVPAATAAPPSLLHAGVAFHSGAATMDLSLKNAAAGSQPRRDFSSGAPVFTGELAAPLLAQPSRAPAGSGSAAAAGGTAATAVSGRPKTPPPSAAAGTVGLPPQPRQPVPRTAASSRVGSEAPTPASSFNSNLVYLDPLPQPGEQLAPPPAALAAFADGNALQGVGGGGGVGGDRRTSESGAAAAAAASILDVASISTDPMRRRRLSADGLSKHASKYLHGHSGGGGGGGSDGASRNSGDGVGSGGDGGDDGGGGGHLSAAAEAAIRTAASPSDARKSHATAGAAVSTAAAAGGGAGGGGAGGGPNGAAGASTSPSHGKAPLISALAFERAPWSQQPPAGAAVGSGGPFANSGLAATAASPVGVGSGGGSSVLFGAKPHPSGGYQHPSGTYGGSPPGGVHGLLAGGATAPAPAAAPAAAAAAAASVVDKLRGYRSSKVLMASALPPTAAANITTGLPLRDSTAAVATASSGGAVTGLSPPKPKLGHFASMRTLRTSVVASSFLDRLSHGSSLLGPKHGRVPSRRGSGGGLSAGGEWPPPLQDGRTGEGVSRRSFRRREGSYSMDGSVASLESEGFPSSGAAVPIFGGSEAFSGSEPFSGSGGFRHLGKMYTSEPGGDVAAGEGDSGHGGGPAWPGGGVSVPGGADGSRLMAPSPEAAAAAGLFARRSYKQLLPRGANGMPLAWSTVIEEDGREGSDGGGGQGDDEGDDDDDDDDDGFNLARAGGRTDLHITC